jgi:hypothetical protein
MKAQWRELADPTIKEHHGPILKTTRLAAIEFQTIGPAYETRFPATPGLCRMLL